MSTDLKSLQNQEEQCSIKKAFKLMFLHVDTYIFVYIVSNLLNNMDMWGFVFIKLKYFSHF